MEEISFVLVHLLILGFLKLLLTDVSMHTPLICVHLLFFNVLIPFSTTDYDLASIFFLYLYLQLLNIPFLAALLFEFFLCLFHAPDWE